MLKQPLLVIVVLHEAQSLAFRTVGFNAGTQITGLNDAAMLVGAQGDGAIIEDIYSISNAVAPYKINLYLSTANDYLRPQQGVFISTFTSQAGAGTFDHLVQMPYILAPVPHVGDATLIDPADGLVVPLQYRALYTW